MRLFNFARHIFVIIQHYMYKLAVSALYSADGRICTYECHLDQKNIAAGVYC